MATLHARGGTAKSSETVAWKQRPAAIDPQLLQRSPKDWRQQAVAQNPSSTYQLVVPPPQRESSLPKEVTTISSPESPLSSKLGATNAADWNSPEIPDARRVRESAGDCAQEGLILRHGPDTLRARVFFEPSRLVWDDGDVWYSVGSTCGVEGCWRSNEGLVTIMNGGLRWPNGAGSAVEVFVSASHCDRRNMPVVNTAWCRELRPASAVPQSATAACPGAIADTDADAADALFDAIDANHDGVISRSEFTVAVDAVNRTTAAR